MHHSLCIVLERERYLDNPILLGNHKCLNMVNKDRYLYLIALDSQNFSKFCPCFGVGIDGKTTTKRW
ncbi:hypothetical protein BLOT_013862 [Blomia tropicalis]|nr:hypothetical protein BLOT_013862 [Blomia tropicalis]